MAQSLFFNSYSEHPLNKLSNFWPVKFIYKGLVYKSAEHAYQAAKCVLPDEAAKIRNSDTAADAKKLGKKVSLRHDWNEIKLQVMKEILRCKFYQNQDLRKILLDTGEATLIHKAPWDGFWGDGKDGSGENRLGEQLMEIRSEFHEQICRYTEVLQRSK